MNSQARLQTPAVARWLVLLALATALVGCANWSPLPPGASQYPPRSWPVNYGHPSRWNDRVFLREPTTTRADVVKCYGSPDASFRDGQVLVYSWETLVYKAYWRWEHDRYRRIAFFIVFKPDTTIVRYDCRWVDERISLEENVNHWVAARETQPR